MMLLIPLSVNAYSTKLILEVIRCESSYDNNRVNKNRDKITGEVWSKDIGYFQINDYYHEKTARSMGLNIYLPMDNLIYGFYLIRTQGLKPWSASKYCWSWALDA